VRVTIERDEELLKKYVPRKFEGKFHVTMLLMCPRRAWYYARGFKPRYDDRSVLKRMRGIALHEYYERGELFREVPIERDGIWGTPDVLGDECVIDYKTTDRRRLDEIPKLWIRQIAAYCYMLGLKKGVLRVVTPESAYKVTIEFEQRELEDNWKQLLMRKESLERYLKENILPVAIPEWEGECKVCEYRHLCRRNAYEDEEVEEEGLEKRDKAVVRSITEYASS